MVVPKGGWFRAHYVNGEIERRVARALRSLVTVKTSLIRWYINGMNYRALGEKGGKRYEGEEEKTL